MYVISTLAMLCKRYLPSYSVVQIISRLVIIHPSSSPWFRAIICMSLFPLISLPVIWSAFLYPLNLSNSRSTTMFASKNRSTHCLIHGSSYLSNLPFLTVPVGMHLRKHVSVKECMAISVTQQVS